MKVSREQFAANRALILEAASRLFRERGFDGVGVDAVMSEAGLTHGAFYSHFKSKDDLITCALEHALAGADLSWRDADDPAVRLAEMYLDDEHCKDVAGGCALAALTGEVHRRDVKTRRTLSESFDERIDQLAATLGGDAQTRRARAIATWAGLVGTLALARAVDDPKRRHEILEAGRAAVSSSRRPRRR